MNTNALEKKWLPVGFSLQDLQLSVKWMDFAGRDLAEPFFNQSVRIIEEAGLPESIGISPYESLLEEAAKLPIVSPKAIILHVSRCGSTLATNVLRQGKRCFALSEAGVINGLLRRKIFDSIPEPNGSHEDLRQRLLQSVLALYAGHYGENAIIKCHTEAILRIPRIRSVWPTTPILILIRNPIEVMVSNLVRPADWLQAMMEPQNSILGWTRLDIQRMTIEEYCARCIGGFCEKALDALDANCWVLDYESLTSENLYKFAQLAGIQLPDLSSPEMSAVLRTYSKDKNFTRIHECDTTQKHNSATSTSLHLAEKFAMAEYRELKEMQTRFLELSIKP